MKKLLFPLLFALSACSTFGELENPLDAFSKDPISSNDAASQFCIDMGGTLGQAVSGKSVCTTKDGRTIDAWDYFLDRY